VQLSGRFFHCFGHGIDCTTFSASADMLCSVIKAHVHHDITFTVGIGLDGDYVEAFTDLTIKCSISSKRI